MEANAGQVLVQGDEIGAGEALRVLWLGEPDGALEADEAREELAGIPVRVAGVATTNGTAPDVVHVTGEAIELLERLPRALDGAAVVLDLSSSAGKLAGGGVRLAARADAVLLGTLEELAAARRSYPELAERTTLLRAPLDLAAFAPVERLRARRDAEVKRFRRYHRLNVAARPRRRPVHGVGWPGRGPRGRLPAAGAHLGAPPRRDPRGRDRPGLP